MEAFKGLSSDPLSDQQRGVSPGRYSSTSKGTPPHHNPAAAESDSRRSKDLSKGLGLFMPRLHGTGSILPDDDTGPYNLSFGHNSNLDSRNRESSQDLSEDNPKDDAFTSSGENSDTEPSREQGLEEKMNELLENSPKDNVFTYSGENSDSEPSKEQELEARVNKLLVTNLGLHQSILDHRLDNQQLEERLRTKATAQFHAGEAHCLQSLKLMGIVPSKDAKPIFKRDENGIRLPLYNDFQRIYHETNVESWLGRAATRMICKDFDTMVDCAVRALQIAQRLKFPPLISRCHFVHGVALYNKENMERALDEFRCSYEGSHLYDLPSTFITQWCNACKEVLGHAPETLNALVNPRTDAPSKRFRSVTDAMRIWGFPTAVESLKRPKPRVSSIYEEVKRVDHKYSKSF